MTFKVVVEDWLRPDVYCENHELSSESLDEESSSLNEIVILRLTAETIPDVIELANVPSGLPTA